MINKTALTTFACLLSILLLCQQSAFASSKSEKDARYAEKVKAGILKLGTGPSARVRLKLKDKTKLSGHISEVGDDSFVITDAKSSSARTITYADVGQVKGNNLSTGAKIAIGVAIAVAIVLLIILKKYCDNEAGC